MLGKYTIRVLGVGAPKLKVGALEDRVGALEDRSPQETRLVPVPEIGLGP